MKKLFIALMGGPVVLIGVASRHCVGNLEMN